jgi:hypothetical protein
MPLEATGINSRPCTPSSARKWISVHFSRYRCSACPFACHGCPNCCAERKASGWLDEQVAACQPVDRCATVGRMATYDRHRHGDFKKEGQPSRLFAAIGLPSMCDAVLPSRDSRRCARRSIPRGAGGGEGLRSRSVPAQRHGSSFPKIPSGLNAALSRIHRSLNKDAPFHRAIERVGAITSQPVLGDLHHQYCRI